MINRSVETNSINNSANISPSTFNSISSSFEKNNKSSISNEFSVHWASSDSDVKLAQHLRYTVLTKSMGAQFPKSYGQYDIDLFDDFCNHLLVKNVENNESVATFRLLTPNQAQRVGGTYFETHFDITRLRGLRDRVVELSKCCIHSDFMNDAVVFALFSELFKFMKSNNLQTVICPANIPMFHGKSLDNHPSSVWQYAKSHHLAPIDFHVRSRSPLIMDRASPASSELTIPPLLDVYLRMGAKVIGSPYYDSNFNSVELPMIMQLTDLASNYHKQIIGN